nr:hypothetical protein [Yersinia enterocolitica]
MSDVLSDIRIDLQLTERVIVKELDAHYTLTMSRNRLGRVRQHGQQPSTLTVKRSNECAETL